MARSEIMDLYGKRKFICFYATKLYLMLSFDLIFNALVLRRNYLKNLKGKTENRKALCIVGKSMLDIYMIY